MEKNIKYKVLIVDDQETNLHILKKSLELRGYDTLVEDSPLNVYKRVQEFWPDLILLDVNMPFLSGFEICKELKKSSDFAEIPVIFITVRSEPEDVIAGFEAGGVDYITKPFNIPELLSRVKTHVELKRSKDHLKKINRTLQGTKQNVKNIDKLYSSSINEIKEKDKIKTHNRLFSIIAHDLKSPIGSFSQLTEMLVESFDELSKEEIIEIVSVLDNSAKYSMELLENLLEWTRSQASEIEFKPYKFNIFDFINKLVNMYQLALKRKQLNLKIDVNKNLMVFADREMIMTVLRNLISNAIKFTNIGGEIIISAQEYQDYITISVKDNGIGMTNEDIRRLFLIDQHFTTNGTNQEKGTGLGLLLCKDFIDRHDSKIWVESELNEGSVFYFTLSKEEK